MTHHTLLGALLRLPGLLVISVLVLGCSPVNAEAVDLSLSCDRFSVEEDIFQTTDASVGTPIKVTLCSNASTGFSWQEPEISDAAVVGFVDRIAGAASASGAAPVVGAAGTETLLFKATAKGTSTVVLHYSQPWPGGTSGEWTYTLTVTVR